MTHGIVVIPSVNPSGTFDCGFGVKDILLNMLTTQIVASTKLPKVSMDIPHRETIRQDTLPFAIAPASSHHFSLWMGLQPGEMADHSKFSRTDHSDVGILVSLKILPG